MILGQWGWLLNKIKCPHQIVHNKTNSQRIQYLNIKNEIIKVLQQMIEEFLHRCSLTYSGVSPNKPITLNPPNPLNTVA
jgi:hypothetical protein